MVKTQDIRSISDHSVASTNDDGTWSAKITIDGFAMYFGEADGVVKLVSGPLPSGATGHRRNLLIQRARLLAQEIFTKTASLEAER